MGVLYLTMNACATRIYVSIVPFLKLDSLTLLCDTNFRINLQSTEYNILKQFSELVTIECVLYQTLVGPSGTRFKFLK